MKTRMRSMAGLVLAVSAATALLAGCAGDPSAPATRGGVDIKDDAAQSDTGDALDILTGGYPDGTSDCSDATSLTPIVVVNTQDQDLSFSITINPGLQNQVNWYQAPYDGAALTGCNILQGSTDTWDVTVPANGSVNGFLLAGGGQWNIIETSSSTAIGAGGSQWYDFALSLGADNGFKDFQLQYQGTGGTDASQNVQTGLFNVVGCDVSGSGSSETVTVEPSVIVSTYQAKSDNQPTYGRNAPICFAFPAG
jgi:hypothetical protein